MSYRHGLELGQPRARRDTRAMVLIMADGGREILVQLEMSMNANLEGLWESLGR